jgi:sulfopyruvate decarboxylase
MLASEALLQVLKAQHIQCYTSFPDKWLGPLLRLLDEDAMVMHFPTTIEREALGIAVGAQLAGMRGALVMQNSGIGNLLNDWASLARNYAIPVPWLVSDRGSPGELVTTQMVWHGRLRAILQAAEIPCQTCTDTAQLPEIAALVQHGYATQQCVAGLFPYTFWRDDLTSFTPRHGGGPSMTAWPFPLHVSSDVASMVQRCRAAWRRFEALECLLESLTTEFLFVTLGDPCKEVYAIRDRVETFYMLGSMGLVLPLGVGFAQAYAALGGRRKTVVVDGDGSQLMQLGALGTFARKQSDLALMVIDNGTYGSTGDQPTLTGSHVHLGSAGAGLWPQQYSHRGDNAGPGTPPAGGAGCSWSESHRGAGTTRRAPYAAGAVATCCHCPALSGHGRRRIAAPQRRGHGYTRRCTGKR